MNVLFVSFAFPPLGGAGVQRAIKFSKYLPQHGINPIVLTTDVHSAQRLLDEPVDPTLLEELPQDIIIERIPCQFPAKERIGKFATWWRIFFSLVDPSWKRWKPELERQLPGILERYKPESICVSIPPFGMAPLFCDFARRHGLPIVLDFRDAWSQWNVGPYGSWIHYRLTFALEKRCLRAASRTVVSSEQIRKDLLTVHPEIPNQKIVTITSGYDAEIEDWSVEHNFPAEREPFVIGYVGRFYYSPAARETMLKPWWKKKPHRIIQYVPRKEDWLYRSPYFFFRAVARLLTRQPELRTRLKIRFAGRKPEWIDEQVTSFGLNDFVEWAGYLDHKSVLEFQARCHCLLVTSSKVLGGADYSIAGKTFEYFRMKKPIVGFVADGAQKEILTASGLAIICDPDDTEDSATKLAALINGKIKLTPNAPFLRSLHQRELSKAMSQVLLAARTAPTSCLGRDSVALAQ